MAVGTVRSWCRSSSIVIGFLMSALAMLSDANAQSLSTKFSCSQVADDGGEKITMADVGEIALVGDAINTFHWESSIFRATHGYDCDIDEEDGLQAEVRHDTDHPAWRVALKDGRAAREKRGYNFERGVNCTIRLDQHGNTLMMRPSCPALCGSRKNFSTIAIDIKTGSCRYE